MRRKALFGAVLTAATSTLATVGCYSDKHKLAQPQIEEFTLPPDEPRFNNAPTEAYRKPPVKKEEKTLLGGSGRPNNPLSPTGF